jgi:hypothetical protein
MEAAHKGSGRDRLSGCAKSTILYEQNKLQLIVQYVINKINKKYFNFKVLVIASYIGILT